MMGVERVTGVYAPSGGPTMSRRPLTITVAAILLVFANLTDFPFTWDFLFADANAWDLPAWILYPGIVLGLVGFLVVYGLWTLKSWSFLAALAVGMLNVLLDLPGFTWGLDEGTLAFLMAVTA